jgi:hypothetical protein
VKKLQQESPPDSARYVGLVSPEPPAASRDGDLEEPEDGLKVWGYMPGHVHYKVGAVEDVTFPRMSWWFNRID